MGLDDEREILGDYTATEVEVETVRNTPRAVRLARRLLAATVALATVAALADHGRWLAAAVVLAVIGSIAALRLRRPAALAGALLLAVTAGGWWSAAEATERQVLNLWLVTPTVAAGLLLLRDDSRAFLRRETTET